MSACDRCRMPGRCCTGFVLNGGDFPTRGVTALEAIVQCAGQGVPFLPLAIADEHGAWRMWCPNLTREGRCGDYENRPTLCRTFQPGENALCAEFGHIPVSTNAEQ